MSRTAFTVKAFGIYLLVLGVSLTLAPNLLLSVFGLAPTHEVWIRVVGVLGFNIGIYYWFAAKSEARAVFQASVYTRCIVIVAFTSFAALGFVSPVLILFGVADFLGGIWTWWALRAEQSARA
jgi:hypothetical protein